MINASLKTPEVHKLKNKQPQTRISVTAKQMQINDTSIATLMTMMNQNKVCVERKRATRTIRAAVGIIKSSSPLVIRHG